MPTLPLLVIFFAVFTQSLSGFGVALVAMAALPGLIGVQTATPLVALVAFTLEIFLLVYYRHALNIRAVWRVALASIAGIPFGVWALRGVDERFFLAALGLFIAGYGLYALAQLRLPVLNQNAWAYAVGFLAGVFGGAYNTSGPPVIVYGDCQRWVPAEFKSNLQGFFFFNSIFVLAGHALGGNLTNPVWTCYLESLPAIAAGIVFGLALDRYLDPVRFRKVVLVLLVGMGLRLLIG